MANQHPWAILLCKYKDDPNDPAQTKISDLAKQWRVSFGNPSWINATWDTDNRTILALYNALFTSSGLLTYNMIQFFMAMTHGKINLDDTKVFTCTLDRTIAQAQALAANPGGGAYQNDTFHEAKIALTNQYGVNPNDFYAIVVSFQYPDYGSQGGQFDGGPGVFMDVRYVKNNGSMRWGHEMGHAFGLDHSRADSPDLTYNPVNCHGGPPDYRDPWDTMSAECDYNALDNAYGRRGPGLNAWNMRSRGWLDEARVWHCPTMPFRQVIQLRPLHSYYLPGLLAAELPPYHENGNFPKYLIEYRIKSEWDSGIPRSAVFVHRFEGAVNQFLGTYSYLQFGNTGNPDLVEGDLFSPGDIGLGPFPSVRVIKLDEPNLTAEIEVSYSPTIEYGLAFQANTSNLWTTGVDHAHGDWKLGIMPGTSPSIAILNDGSYGVAFQANTGNLWIVGSATTPYVGDTGYGMMAGTSPSITALHKGGYEVAFQANTGNLWTIGSDQHGDWKLGMMAGTSPSIAALSNGDYEVAFQANTGNLWTVGSKNHGDWKLGMMTGTSPSIAALSNNEYEVAFQANTGNLWTIGSNNHGDWKLGMMAGTSPSIAGLRKGGYEVAFQANTGNLWTIGSHDNHGDWKLGMRAGTSPSIAALSNGDYEVAFQANTGNLWTIGSDQHGDWKLGMMAGTSPSIAKKLLISSP